MRLSEIAKGLDGPSIYFKDPSGQNKRAVFANKQARNRALLKIQRKRYPEVYAQSMKAIEASGRSQELIGKAAEELPIPDWARDAFSSSKQVVSPLDMYAGSRMMAFGLNNMKGKVNWPWRKDRMARGGLQFNQSRSMIYSPVGYGRSS